MKSLLENDLPAFYGVGRRCICDENTTSFTTSNNAGIFCMGMQRETRLCLGTTVWWRSI